MCLCPAVCLSYVSVSRRLSLYVSVSRRLSLSMCLCPAVCLCVCDPPSAYVSVTRRLPMCL